MILTWGVRWAVPRSTRRADQRVSVMYVAVREVRKLLIMHIAGLLKSAVVTRR